MIEGGFYLKAKKIQEAEIMHAPPHVREIWDWLLMKAMFANGFNLDRGQVLLTYDIVRDALSWNIGWRIMRYSKDDCEKAMKWLRKAEMVTTQRTTRGVIVTICKYDYYQNINNYENHKESRRTSTGKPKNLHTIDKEYKEVKNIKKEYSIPPSLLEVEAYCKERDNSISPQAFLDYYEARGWLIGKTKIKSWQACIRTWEQRDQTSPSSKSSGFTDLDAWEKEIRR